MSPDLWSLLSWEGRVHWFAKRGSKGDRRVAGGTSTSPTGLEAVTSKFEALGFDIYVGLNPTREVWQKANRDDVLAWRRVFIDLDPAAASFDISQALVHLTIIVRGLIPIEPPCMTIIRSGRGAQLWLEVEPIIFQDGDFGRSSKIVIERGIARFLTDVAKAFGTFAGMVVDPCTSDLARVARMPYTINTKTGLRSEVIATASRPISPSLFERWMTSEPEPQRFDKGMTKAEVLLHLTVLADRYLHEGISEPGRHRAAWHTAKRLAELGVEREEATEMVLVGAGMCRPPLPADDAIRVVRQVYREIE